MRRLWRTLKINNPDTVSSKNLDNIKHKAEAVFVVIKAIGVAAAVFWFFFHKLHDGDVVADALVTRIKEIGVSDDHGKIKLEIALTDTAALPRVQGNMIPGVLDPEYAKNAIIRAHSTPNAIVGAKILWVDPNPGNNVREERIFKDLGILVQDAISADDAIEKMRVNHFHPDIIITNNKRDYPSHIGGDRPVPLVNCPAYYFDEGAGDLNAVIAKGEPKKDISLLGLAGGFYMIERLHNIDTFAEWTDPFDSRVIVYSGSAGGRSFDRCARVVTNYTDVMLQATVTLLQELASKRQAESKLRIEAGS